MFLSRTCVALVLVALLAVGCSDASPGSTSTPAPPTSSLASTTAPPTTSAPTTTAPAADSGVESGVAVLLGAPLSHVLLLYLRRRGCILYGDQRIEGVPVDCIQPSLEFVLHRPGWI